MNRLLLNPLRMVFQVPGVLGGLLLAGSKGPEHGGAGNGDCILLDGAAGFLGIADGSERSPQASREFLREFAGRVNVNRPAGRQECFRCFQEAAEGVLQSFRYEDRTTFVCLLSGGEGSLFYLCGGDSLLFHLDPRASRIRFRNRANMGFAGRSTHVADSGRLDLQQGDLVLLATDGVWDLTDGNSEELVRAFFQGLKQGPLYETAARLTRERHPAFQADRARPYDDLGVLLLNPSRIQGLPWRMIAGGTSAAEETRYRRACEQGVYPDRELALAPRNGKIWVFPEELSEMETGISRNPVRG
jgi:hypothetical protein